jgi:surface antigen
VPGKPRPFGGNAKNWYNNAKAAGYSVGTSASVGAIAVMTNGWS